MTAAYSFTLHSRLVVSGLVLSARLDRLLKNNVGDCDGDENREEEGHNGRISDEEGDG